MEAERPIVVLIKNYADSHCNPTNEFIHCVCVPVIVLSLLGMIWTAHPLAAWIAVILSLIYYIRLSIPFACGMLVMSAAMLWLLYSVPQDIVLPGSIGLFVVAWIGQFVGHHIEGKKPSFFDDLRYLLIGPLFVLSLLYRRLHISY